MPKQWGSANSESPKGFNQSVHPDTFVEIDSHSFKELVQRLTGASENSESKKLPVTRPARTPKKDGPAEGMKSGWNCGFQVGIQKPAFKLQDRRKFQRKLEINLGLNDHHYAHRLTGNHYYGLSSVTLPALISSPITPLGPFDPFNSPPSYYYDSTPTSCCQSLCLEEEKEKFCFEGSAVSVKREPELLPLFPLHSSRQSSP
ncbi:hypothetical protein SUGI_0324610 [Cryptomeria japonica]|nr:hypothetical protein SUGI_0324610 [Cryptomeria japonica]